MRVFRLTPLIPVILPEVRVETHIFQKIFLFKNACPFRTTWKKKMLEISPFHCHNLFFFSFFRSVLLRQPQMHPPQPQDQVWPLLTKWKAFGKICKRKFRDLGHDRPNESLNGVHYVDPARRRKGSVRGQRGQPRSALRTSTIYTIRHIAVWLNHIRVYPRQMPLSCIMAHLLAGHGP